MTEKRHGKGLLFIVTLVLAAGVIKYADIPFAQTVREKAASALSGAANAVTMCYNYYTFIPFFS